MGFGVIKNGEVLDCESLARDICKMSANLKARKLPCVEIYLSSSYDFMVALFGALNAGIKAYILPKEAHLGLGFFINDSNFAQILGDSRESKSDCSSSLRGSVSAANIALQSTNQNNSLDCHDLLRKSRNDDSAVDCHDLQVSFATTEIMDLPFFLSTSGSSKDKGDIVPKTLHQMIAEAKVLCETLGATSDDIFIASATHQHLYGLTHKIFLPLIANAKILDSELKFPELILAFCAESSAKNIILITSPTLLKYLANQPDLRPLSNLKAIVSAGARLECEIRAHFRNAINLDIFEIYGSTESGIVAYNAHFNDKFIPFQSVELKTHSDSRLIIRSAWTQNALTDAEFISNDSARIENGALILQGRMDRIVKFFEKRVSLDSLEAQIKGLEIIDDCFVGVLDGQNHAHCILILSDFGKELFLQNGKKGVIDAIKTLKIKEIRHFHIRAKLPYNERGKIAKKDFIACVCEKIAPKFEIIKLERDLLQARSYIDEGSFYFDGHFGDFPLVPGFVELGFVVDLARAHLDLGAEFEIECVKFNSFMRPFSEVEVEIWRKNSKIYFQILSDKKECANGRISPKN